MAGSGRSWFGRLWDRWFGKKRRAPARGGIPAAPHTLVARVSAVEEAREREMLRLAEESIRRGHPEQAAIVYRKAVERYRADGKAQKELASLNLWARVAPHDPDVWTGLGNLHAESERTRAALEAFTRAAALWRQMGKDEKADLLEARIADLRAGRGPSRDLPSTPGLTPPPRDPTPPPEVEQSVPVAPSPLVVSSARLDEEGPIELEMPESGTHDGIDDAEAEALLGRVAPRAPSLAARPPPEDEPERLPTGALSALEDDALSADDLADLDDDDEPEPLSASALEVVEEPARPPIQETETEPGATYDQTVAGLNARDLPGFGTEESTDDEISPELMAELTAMADEEATGEEGAATIAMPAIDAATRLKYLGGDGAPPRPKFGIPDAATVMDPGGLPNAAWPDTTDRAAVDEDDELEEVDDEYAAPDTATRGYSADELAELQRLLDKKGRR